MMQEKNCSFCGSGAAVRHSFNDLYLACVQCFLLIQKREWKTLQRIANKVLGLKPSKAWDLVAEFREDTGR